MTQIEKIRQEIERRIEALKPRGGQGYTLCEGTKAHLRDLLSFLKTLSEEPDKSLKEAAEEYADTICPVDYPESFNDEQLRNAFIAGAEWQASQMPMPEDTVLFQKGVAEGRRLEREDMLKDALEGVAHPDDCEIWVNLIGYGYKFNDGDKVRIVVLKEEED